MSFLKYRAHPGERVGTPIPDTTNATKKSKPQKRSGFFGFWNHQPKE
jgi:hypothetical protein